MSRNSEVSFNDISLSLHNASPTDFWWVLRCEHFEDGEFYVRITRDGEHFNAAECDRDGKPYSLPICLGKSDEAFRNFYRHVLGTA